MKVPNRNSVSRYITSCQRIPRLTHEEELELARRWRAGDDKKAADRLVRGNLRYVVAIALQYRRYGAPVSELIAEGNFGLVHALGKFDPERGFRFVTYASYWVRAYVLNCVILSWSLVGGGSGALRTKMFFKVRRERARITALLGEGDHADDLLAQTLGMSRSQVQAAVRRLELRDVSLDSKVFGDSTTSLMDTLVSGWRDPERTLATEQSHERSLHVVHSAIRSLDQRERYIVQNRLLADREDELSLAAIGRYFGVSRERARQLEVRAKRRLRARIAELSGELDADLSSIAKSTSRRRIDPGACERPSPSRSA